jgi:glycosyltransferase involved in cell wall biosynthesis
MSRSLNICYLLASTELSGGVRVVLDQARALAARGHTVTVLAHCGDHSWYPYPVTVSYVENFASAAAALQPQVVIATFWTTVAPALACRAALTVHLCQGCEWECPEYDDIADQIDAAYLHPIPKLTIGPWLDEKLNHRFGSGTFAIACVGQCVDTHLYHPSSDLLRWLGRWRRQAPRLLVPGMFESWVKGIKVALAAVEILRDEGRTLHLTRVSSQPQNVGETSYTTIDAYYQAVTPVRMAQLYREADIVLTPSYDGEGFGLPFAEALASGTAVVATTIPSYLSLDAHRDYACFVPEGDTAALASAVRGLLDNPAQRIRMGQRGAKLLHGRYGAEAVAMHLEQVFSEWLGYE